MGLAVDTSVLIDAARKRLPLQQVVARLAGRGPLTISAVSLIEVAHGIGRARTVEIERERRSFLAAVQDTFATVPLYGASAIRAGLLDGELTRLGFTIGLADAAITATALMRGDGVATLNVRHFRLVSGLDVVEM